MIKMYCDRCEQEIVKEQKNMFDELYDAILNMLKLNPKTKYILCIDGKKPHKLTLCKECNEALQRFMQKTEIHQIALEKSQENDGGGDEND